MQNNEVNSTITIYINGKKTNIESIKDKKLRNIIENSITRLDSINITDEEIRLSRQLCRYCISFRKPYFMELFYSRDRDLLRIDFNQAIEKLNTTKEELFNTYEKYIIDDFNSKYNNIFKDIVTFKRTTVNNYLALKASEETDLSTLIERYEDIKILDEENEKKVDFLRVSLSKKGNTYFLKESKMRYGFNPYLVLAKKNKVRRKKVEKIVECFLHDEVAYASRYLNADITAKKTYDDDNVEIYILDKRE